MVFPPPAKCFPNERMLNKNLCSSSNISVTQVCIVVVDYRSIPLITYLSTPQEEDQSNRSLKNITSDFTWEDLKLGRSK